MLRYPIVAALLFAGLCAPASALAQCPDFDGDGTPDGTGCGAGNVPPVPEPTPVVSEPNQTAPEPTPEAATTSSAPASGGGGANPQAAEGLIRLIGYLLIPVGLVLAPGPLLEGLAGSPIGDPAEAERRWNDVRRDIERFEAMGARRAQQRARLAEALANARDAPSSSQAVGVAYQAVAPARPRGLRIREPPPPGMSLPVAPPPPPLTRERFLAPARAFASQADESLARLSRIPSCEDLQSNNRLLTDALRRTCEAEVEWLRDTARDEIVRRSPRLRLARQLYNRIDGLVRQVQAETERRTVHLRLGRDLARENQATIDGVRDASQRVISCMSSSSCDTEFVTTLPGRRARAYLEVANEYLHGALRPILMQDGD